MYGAILGDIIGSPYEFDRGNKSKDFPLFSKKSYFTDDSVMTIAVAEALMDVGEDACAEEIEMLVAASLRKWGKRYPNAGYGGRFRCWLADEAMGAYGSYGNGSAMRVSAAGWLYDSMERTREVARATAMPTHNHPEGIKGAEATAAAIFAARTGWDKAAIKDYIEREFGYDLSRSCDEIRPDYYHVESCQETVPEAITAFLEGSDFEDVIRTAVSLGGDCDTLTCIAGSIAEAYYGVGAAFMDKVKEYLSEEMLEVLKTFEWERYLVKMEDYDGEEKEPLAKLSTAEVEARIHKVSLISYSNVGSGLGIYAKIFLNEPKPYRFNLYSDHWCGSNGPDIEKTTFVDREEVIAKLQELQLTKWKNKYKLDFGTCVMDGGSWCLELYTEEDGCILRKRGEDGAEFPANFEELGKLLGSVFDDEEKDEYDEEQEADA